MTSLSLPQILLAEVKAKAKQGDPEDVLNVIDRYCKENSQPTMNVGRRKGKILENMFSENSPSIVVELGSYMGYSAILMARLFKNPGAMLYAVEPNPEFVKVVREMVDHAGLSDKITVIEGSSSDVIPVLREKYGLQSIDFLFIDHVKSLYKSDLLELEKTGLLQKEAVIAADNVIYPGAPDYLEYVRNNPKYKNTFFEAHLDFDPTIMDGIEKSVILR